MNALDWIFEGIGMIGMVCFLSAYFLLQAEKWKAYDLAYLGCNLAGSILLMISLMWHWNLSAFMLEAAWMLISMYGIAKTMRKRREKMDDQPKNA